jgi:hypothetical protein
MNDNYFCQRFYLKQSSKIRFEKILSVSNHSRWLCMLLFYFSMDFLIQAIDLKFDFVPFCERKFHLVKKCDNECLSIVSCVRWVLHSFYYRIFWWNTFQKWSINEQRFSNAMDVTISISYTIVWPPCMEKKQKNGVRANLRMKVSSLYSQYFSGNSKYYSTDSNVQNLCADVIQWNFIFYVRIISLELNNSINTVINNSEIASRAPYTKTKRSS